MALATLIRRMTEAGAPPEAIALAVEEIEAMQISLEARRAGDRERKRKQRERQKSTNVTGHSEDSHGTVTDQSPHTPLENTSNLLTFSPRSETNLPPKRISKDIPKRPPPNGKRTAWGGGPPPNEWIEWAMKHKRWKEWQAKQEAAKFIDYCLANRKLYADWRAAWRNWCRSPYQTTEQELLRL